VVVGLENAAGRLGTVSAMLEEGAGVAVAVVVEGASAGTALGRFGPNTADGATDAADPLRSHGFGGDTIEHGRKD
jgi:hypothetical protein